MAFHDTRIAHAPLVEQLRAVQERIRTAYARRVEYGRVYDELDCYNDRELADLGISRADIPRIAGDAARAI